MHPRTNMPSLPRESAKHADELLAYIREHGPVHPNDVEAAFGRGNVRNYWGGSSRAMTHLMDTLHYRGLLQVVRRDRGIRVYDLSDRACLPHSEEHADARVDRLIDILVNLYAPLPGANTVVCGQPSAIRRPAVSNQAESGFHSGENPARSRTSRRRQLVLAGGREPSLPFTRKSASSARTVRSSGLGPPAFRNVLGLAVPIRGIHTRIETKMGILRSAHVVARRNYRLGQSDVQERRAYPTNSASSSAIVPTVQSFARALADELESIKIFLGG